MSDTVTDPNYPGYVYVRGPMAGQPVLFEPGWPPPDAIGDDADPPRGCYVLDRGRQRYVWQPGVDIRNLSDSERQPPLPS